MPCGALGVPRGFTLPGLLSNPARTPTDDGSPATERAGGGILTSDSAGSGSGEAEALLSVPAFADLVDPHLPGLSRMLRRLLPTAEDAEDVLQETLLYAYVGMRGLRRMELLGAWLRTIAYNRAMQWQRCRYGEQGAGAHLWRSGEVPGPEARIVLREDMTAALGLLSRADRDAVILRYVQGFTSAEIGRLRGEIASTVRWRLRRALGVLRNALTEAEEQRPEAKNDGGRNPEHTRGHHPGPGQGN